MATRPVDLRRRPPVAVWSFAALVAGRAILVGASAEMSMRRSDVFLNILIVAAVLWGSRFGWYVAVAVSGFAVVAIPAVAMWPMRAAIAATVVFFALQLVVLLQPSTRMHCGVAR